MRACVCAYVCACVCVCASALKILSNKVTNQLFPLNMDECKEKREKRKKERERESYDLVGKIKITQSKINVISLQLQVSTKTDIAVTLK